MPDYQTLFNIVVGILGVIGGWMLNALWGALKDLQQADKELADKVAGIEVLVAGQYVTRKEYSDALNVINLKLDRIQQTLSEKADRS
jgi:CHASE3 domain sensor protein